jgi:hypothetical protein
MFTMRSAALLVAFGACSDSPASPDARLPDALPADALPADAPAQDAAADASAGCTGIRFTGEYVDWDSSSSPFCGIFGAEFAVPGGGERQTTAPNGRFDICIPDAPVTLVDITPPAAASTCSMPPAAYTIAGIAVANKAVITAGGAWSGRAFVPARQAVDSTKAQVFVHVNGTPVAVSIGAAHESSQARTSGTWAAGNTGEEVFFLNVDPGTGTTDLTAAGAIGTGPIPLVAGKVTNVSIIAN